MVETPDRPTTTAEEMPSIQILGLPVHSVDMTAALTAIRTFAASGTPHHIVTADASMLVMAQQDPELHAIISRADLVTPDSIGVLWAAARKGARLNERVSGVEIAERLCEESARHGHRIFFLGAAPGVAATAAEKMRAKYPGAAVVGSNDGYFAEEEVDEIVQRVRATEANVLLVAMGIPKQEKWIRAHRDALGCSVLIGVGGTLDVLSGTVKRAPRIMRALRLEWLWRVISNPSKINKVRLLPRFVRLVMLR